ncbi:MAG: gliding motility-associated C-terminal domain-containing protein [Bacteroidales bacterium]|nr:gliding motility-associated C-terminal domain-containing protein [Bacteroidales bacterium]
MSDSLGNLLFYSSGKEVWNRNGDIMMNGDGLLGGYEWEQSCVAFPKPGSDSQYYLFNVSGFVHPEGLYYSVIDMSLDGGLGGVTYEKNINLEAAFWAHNKLFVLKSSNADAYWVITRLFNDDSFACFFVDINGVNPEPVLSSTGIFREFVYGDVSYMKVSLNKKYLVAGYRMGGTTGLSNPLYAFDICKFDENTGKVSYLYMINHYNPDNNKYDYPEGCEFSPDSKLLYLTFDHGNTIQFLYQYDIQYVEDSVAFVNSAILISNQSGRSLQLSNDGKIYCSKPPENVTGSEYVFGVISDPWIKGINCNFIPDVVYLLGRRAQQWTPNILLDYLYRFEWEADDYCQGSTVKFIPHFVPTPDSVVWFFDEFAPGSTSNELSPTYTFQFPGIHEVSVDIWYPTGRFEHTSREIEIFPRPNPDLGPDTLICEGASVTLYANCDADFYTWNGIPGTSQYFVYDSGFYRVSASFLETGCSGSDTIHVVFYLPILIDETDLVITPTSCNGANGSIIGLYALGSMPLAYSWKDLSGVGYGSDIDVFGMPAGQYVLTITDGNGCETVSAVYTIEDAGNLQVLDVQLTQSHCGRPDGQIVVHAFSPSGSVLEYSIDDGVTYQADSVFLGLVGASYVIRVKDENGCEGFYLENPVLLADIPGPQVTQVNITNETDFLGNGAIEIIASGSTPVIYYSIDGGENYQSNNGTFNNLGSGIYDCMILDENGCDTTFTVEIQNVILTHLHAVTGEGGHCLGNTALVPVNVDNFNSVATFHLKLGYNADNLQCEGFANVHPQLVDSLTGWVDQGAGEINLAWNSAFPVTFGQPEKVADLVFTTKNPGQGQLSWYTGTSESYFTNAAGYPIPAQFQTGEVKIYEPPEILLSPSKTVCEGQLVSIMSIALGNQPPIDYSWIYPSGDTSSFDPIFFSVTQADAGNYTLLATDHVGCSDQKTINLIVSDNPVAAFHGSDTLEFHPSDVLDAGTGLSSYLWNTGDTTESIMINSEGKYWVEMESQFGCTGRDSIYIKLTTDEIPSNYIFIPNAFSPDGDGLNDIFAAIATSDYIQKFHMLIFDRWGGEIFESNNIMLGWDGTKHGTPLPGGIYTYKITYSIYSSFGDYTDQVRLGTVMLVR